LQTYKEKPTAEMLDFPMLQMELGNGFIESVIASGKSDKNGLILKSKIKK
jgi:hypothetical protein